MRLRLAIWFLVPCLSLAWPLVPIAEAQEKAPPAAKADAAGAKAAAKPPGEKKAAKKPAKPAAKKKPPAAPPKQDKWGDAHSIGRVKRPFIYWPKLLALVLLVLAWVKSSDWVNRDSQIFNLGYGKWNPIVFFPFFAILLLVTFPVIVGVSNFWVAFGALLLSFLATYVPYVDRRNRVVELHQKVFTPDWFRYETAQMLKKVGIKGFEAERKAEYEKGAPVDLMAIASTDERANQANLITARQSPGYLLVKELVADMADRRSDRAILDYTQQAVVARQHIDGVWHNSESRDRESGDVMLAAMKTLANMSAGERRKKQEGKFAAKYNDHSYVCPVTSQGVPTGERVIVQLLGGAQRSFKKYEDLGMRAKTAEQWSALMSLDKGVLIISGMPEGGITTLTDVSLMETDRLLRDFVAIEEVNHREREIENIEVTTFDASKDESAAKLLPAMIRKYPNVYVVRDLSDTDAAKILFNEIRDEDRLLITNVQAKSAPEALLRMLQLKVPHRDFATTVTAVLCMRLVRKLCDACKVAYAPTPDLLKKLGIPQGKIEALYRVPKPEEIDKPCKECGGLGFKGRTGLFELLEVDEQIREVLLKKPQPEFLRKAARAAGMRPFQEEGLLLVAKGLTSLAELQRVLKE